MCTAIFFVIYKNLLLGWNPYWEYYSVYFPVYYATVAILVDLHQQKFINMFFYLLFFACIETHIFVPNCSTFHIFLSILKNLLFCNLR